MEPMSRARLDGRRSEALTISGQTSMIEDSDPYGALAAHFNDYVSFCPQNQLIMYEIVDGISKPKNPFEPVSFEVTALADECSR